MKREAAKLSSRSSLYFTVTFWRYGFTVTSVSFSHETVNTQQFWNSVVLLFRLRVCINWVISILTQILDELEMFLHDAWLTFQNQPNACISDINKVRRVRRHKAKDEQGQGLACQGQSPTTLALYHTSRSLHMSIASGIIQDSRATIVRPPTSDSPRQRHKVAPSPVVLLADRDADRLVAETGRRSHEHSRDDVERFHHDHMKHCTPPSHRPPTCTDSLTLVNTWYSLFPSSNLY